MRLLISAGGTGGGVYPALSVTKALLRVTNDEGHTALRLPSPVSVLWVGSIGGMEAELVGREGLPFQAIHGGGVHGVGGRLFLLNAFNLLRGFVEALAQVWRFRPNAVFVTGGYITVPVALAAWLSRVPVLMYLPDIEPGLALQFIARLARKIAVTVDDSRKFVEGRKVVVTGYPTRPALDEAKREDALEQLGLDPARRSILVTGGSRGARSLNRAVFAALADWLKDFQVIHLSGQLDWAEVEQAREALPAQLRANYHPFPYLHEMGQALAAADVVVSRAGASALGEYPLFGLPAILVPYPYAWRYQKVNADYLVERGAALRLNDEDLADQLASTVRGLLADEERLARMRAAARAAARPHAAQQIAAEFVALAGGARP
jgi:UDP-N-acetylglucosamine--N-acetylmuramyl-(pentapeptide) pyrophosphoryl-undecaprenol N-acetylglucosamine transferase